MLLLTLWVCCNFSAARTGSNRLGERVGSARARGNAGARSVETIAKEEKSMWHIRMGVVLMAASAAFLAAQDPPGRVGRLNYHDGPVSFQPAGMNEWVDADINRPLTTGDNIWVGDRGRAEIHIGSTALRLGSNTALPVPEPGRSDRPDPPVGRAPSRSACAISRRTRSSRSTRPTWLSPCCGPASTASTRIPIRRPPLSRCATERVR